MATFEVDVQGATYQVDAPDETTAWKWANATHNERPAQPTEQPSIGDRLKRAAGLTGRAAIEGVGDVAGIVGNPISAMTGLRRPSEIASDLTANLPQPNTPTERVVNAVGRGLVGAGAMVGAGSALSQAPGMLGRFGEVLATQPGAQLLAGGGAGAGSQIARESGAGPVGQVVGGLMGGMTAQGIASTVKRVPDVIKGFTGEQQFIVPPSQSPNPTMAARSLETLSGKAKTEQLATVKNQALTNAKVTQDLGFPKDTQLTPELLKNYRAQVYDEAYLPVKQSGMVTPDAKLQGKIQQISSEAGRQLKDFPDSPIAASIFEEAQNLSSAAQKPFNADTALTKIQELRELATKAYKADDTTLGKAYKDFANAMEDQISRHLNKISAFLPDGKKTIENFQNGRKAIAQSHSIEESLTGGAGDVYNVNARNLANQLKRGVPLSGNALEIAKQASSFPKSMVVPVAGADNPLTLTDLFTSGAFGGGGAGLAALTGANPVLGAAAAAALPIARPIARNLVMSQPYQRVLMQPGQKGNRLMDLVYAGMAANQGK